MDGIPSELVQLRHAPIVPAPADKVKVAASLSLSAAFELVI